MRQCLSVPLLLLDQLFVESQALALAAERARHRLVPREGRLQVANVRPEVTSLGPEVTSLSDER